MRNAESYVFFRKHLLSFIRPEANNIFNVHNAKGIKILTRLRFGFSHLKGKSCKSYNNKYMIASIQITKTKIFTFISVLIFKLLSRKVLFINRKDNRNC